jgi:phosphopantothenoylcysteine synthetase/decarboxylase
VSVKAAGGFKPRTRFTPLGTGITEEKEMTTTKKAIPKEEEEVIVEQYHVRYLANFVVYATSEDEAADLVENEFNDMIDNRLSVDEIFDIDVEQTRIHVLGMEDDEDDDDDEDEDSEDEDEDEDE